MTQSRNTKRAWLASVLSLVLCAAMLIGSTFAWFTDSATTGVNRIVAGNLDIKLSYKNANDDSYTEVSEDTTDLFVDKDGKAMLWEPGAVSVCYFKLENLGTLDIKYALSVIAKDVVTYEGAALSKVLKTAVVPMESDSATLSDRAAAIEKARDEKAESVLTYTKKVDVMKAPTKETPSVEYFAMVIYFPEEIGNTYEGATYNLPTGATPLETTLQISLLATQAVSENDSFGNTYDKEALMPNEKLVTNQAEFSDLVDSIKGGNSDGVDSIYLAAGEYDIFDICQNWGSYNMNIIGATNADGTPATVINVDNSTNWGIKGTVKNITFKDSTNSKILKFMDGNGLHADVVVDNCVFDGASMQFTGVATVKNSTFKGNNAAWSGIQYSSPSGDIVIENCSFNGYRFTNLQVTDENAHKDVTVTVKDCTIGALVDGWSENYSNEGVTIWVDDIVLEGNTIDCDVWTPSRANVTETNNKTSTSEEVSYKNW